MSAQYLSLARRATNGNPAPAQVHDVLNSPGRPLDPATRGFMETRFGQTGRPRPVQATTTATGTALTVSPAGDALEGEAERTAARALQPQSLAAGPYWDFGRVRIHSDDKAAKSAQAVNAQAYTVGEHIVFGTGRFNPGNHAGQHLLAHELAHTVQQPGARLMRQPDDKREKPDSPNWTLPPYQPKPISPPRSTGVRLGVTPCLSGSVCDVPVKGSAWDFVQKTDAESAPRSKTPPVAKNVKQAAENLSPGVLKDIFEVTYNPGLAKEVAAQVDKCKEFNVSAKDPNASCMEVPENLEKEAERFNKGAECLQTDKPEDTISGCFVVADLWKPSFIETMVHEAAHITFGRNMPTGISSRTSNEITIHELSEFYAQFSEFPLHYREVQSNITNHSVQEQQEMLDSANKAWVKLHVESPGEGFRGMWTKIRCINDCDKATQLVRSMQESAMAGWAPEIRAALLKELGATDALDWPMPAPSLQPPPDAHPKQPPLYQPRADFATEMQQSLEDLP